MTCGCCRKTPSLGSDRHRKRAPGSISPKSKADAVLIACKKPEVGLFQGCFKGNCKEHNPVTLTQVKSGSIYSWRPFCCSSFFRSVSSFEGSLEIPSLFWCRTEIVLGCERPEKGHRPQDCRPGKIKNTLTHARTLSSRVQCASHGFLLVHLSSERACCSFISALPASRSGQQAQHPYHSTGLSKLIPC